MNKNGKNLFKLFLAAVAAAAILLFSFLSSGKTTDAAQRTFLVQFVLSGGAIVWFVLLPLSIITVGLIIDYFLNITEPLLLGRGYGAEIIITIRRDGWQKLSQILADKTDLVSLAIFATVRNPKIDRRLFDMQLQMQEAAEESLHRQVGVLLRRIEPLNIIGNISPMVGLFGTVYGMIKLFNSIVSSGGQPSPSQMADGISVALVTTFWGLLIAIPALSAHGLLSNKIEQIRQKASVQTELILAELKNSIEKTIER